MPVSCFCFGAISRKPNCGDVGAANLNAARAGERGLGTLSTGPLCQTAGVDGKPDAPRSDEHYLVVARVGRPHGLKGEVALELRTDEPAARLAVGARLETEPPDAGPLTVASARQANGRWFVRFAEVADRTAAESLRGVELLTVADSSDDEDAWYRHELVGLRVELPDGRVVGEVVGLEHLPAQDALVIRETPSVECANSAYRDHGFAKGARTLVPLVSAIVPLVDVAGGRVVIDPPGGLLASDAARLDVDARDVDGEPDTANETAEAGDD